jgi:nucleoside-diphosphate-sugar epimerase
VRSNRILSRAVLEALEVIGVDRLFVASAGAAAFADDASAADNLRCYGRLKLDDEALFAGWAEDAVDSRRVAIARIYSVSGPHINKHQTYALASFVLAALADQPIEVYAPMRVIRSYVAVRDLLSLVIAALLAPEGESVLRFDTGGEALELAEVAASVARVLGGKVLRQPSIEPQENRYVGDASTWIALLARFDLTELSIDEQVAETAAWLARRTE